MWNLLGYSYAGLSQKERALETMDRYLRLAPGEPNPYDSKGEIYFMFGELDSASAWYRRALSLRADFVTVEKMGFNAVVAGRFAEAEQYFDRMSASGDAEMQEWAGYSRASILMRQGKLLEARRVMQKRLARHEAENVTRLIAEDLLCLVYLSYGIGDFPGMLSNARKFSARQQKDPTNKFYGRHILAWAHLKNGNRAEAFRIMDGLEKDVYGGQPSWRAIFDYSRGILAFEEGDYLAACGYFKRALETQLPNRAPQFAYAVSLLRSGRLTQGIYEMERISWWAPISTPVISLGYLPMGQFWPVNSARAHYWLGVAYEQSGDSERARQEYRKFLSIWNSADVETPELKEAHARLGKLDGLAAK
jgi:Flp pilus assembly protein TadD